MAECVGQGKMKTFKLYKQPQCGINAAPVNVVFHLALFLRLLQLAPHPFQSAPGSFGQALFSTTLKYIKVT